MRFGTPNARRGASGSVTTVKMEPSSSACGFRAKGGSHPSCIGIRIGIKSLIRTTFLIRKTK